MHDTDQQAIEPARRPGVSRIDIAVLVACFAVLAAVAVPRQLQLSGEVRRADAQSLAGSVASAVQLANSFWLASDQPARLELARGDVAIINGYPSMTTVANTLEESETAAFEFSRGRWQHRDSRSSAPCGVSYSPPAAIGELPRIVIEQSGC